jgi:hypothetical protein
MKVKKTHEIMEKKIKLKSPYFGRPGFYISKYGIEITVGYPLEFPFFHIDKTRDLDPDLTLFFLKELEKEIKKC